jgi:hypothetical protein
MIHAAHLSGSDVRQGPGPAGGYFVRSESTPGAWWYVCETGNRDLPIACTCPAGQRALDIGSRKMCRHLRAVFAHVTEINRKAARPLAPPNIAAMVD